MKFNVKNLFMGVVLIIVLAVVFLRGAVVDDLLQVLFFFSFYLFLFPVEVEICLSENDDVRMFNRFTVFVYVQCETYPYVW